jgi:DNA-binding PadR family transcriptional regulator
MSLGMVLLGVLAGGPAHGYDLKRAHDERFPSSRKLAYGQVYSTLSRLERDGLVETVETAQAGGPERTVYAATAAGEAQLREWLEQTEDPGPYTADELVRKTITALHSRGDADGFLRRQRAVHLDKMRLLTRDRTSVDGAGARIAVDHTIAHLDADLRWLEETRERVGQGMPASERDGGDSDE